MNTWRISAWRAARIGLAAAMLLLEPLIRFVLLGIAVLTAVVAILFRYSGVSPDFPFWPMIGFAVASVLALLIYQMVLRLLSR